MKSEFAIQGRCECSKIKYQVNAPSGGLVHCHCKTCQRSFGALFGTFGFVNREFFVVDDPEDLISVFATEHGRWHFCSACGSRLFTHHDNNPERTWYMIGTLDKGCLPGHPEGSEQHIFVSSKSPLYDIPDGVPTYERFNRG